MTERSDVTLVLFDIDGTLVQTLSAGLRGLTGALEDLYGFAGALDGIPVAGRTDRAILRDVFARVGVEWHETHIASVRDAYFGRLAHELARPLPPGTTDFGVLPGVERAIAAMESDASFLSGCSRETSPVAPRSSFVSSISWKRFRLGAFGDDHVDRRDLVPLAVAEARRLGVEPARVVIIGDTPLDIDCAHAHGAVAVAVATGHYSKDRPPQCRRRCRARNVGRTRRTAAIAGGGGVGVSVSGLAAPGSRSSWWGSLRCDLFGSGPRLGRASRTSHRAVERPRPEVPWGSLR